MIVVISMMIMTIPFLRYCRSMQELTLQFPLAKPLNIKLALEGKAQSITDDVRDQKVSTNSLPTSESEDSQKEPAVDQLVYLSGEPVKLMAPGEFITSSHTSPMAEYDPGGAVSGLESLTVSTVSLASSLSLGEETPQASATPTIPQSPVDLVSQLSHTSSRQFSPLMATLTPFMSVGGLPRPSPMGLFQSAVLPQVPGEIISGVGDEVDVGVDDEGIDPGNVKGDDEGSLPELESSPVAVSSDSSSPEEQSKNDEANREDESDRRDPLPLFPSASGPEQFNRLFEESEKEVDRVLALAGRGDPDEQPQELVQLTARPESASPALDESSSTLESPTLPLDDPLLKE